MNKRPHVVTLLEVSIPFHFISDEPCLLLLFFTHVNLFMFSVCPLVYFLLS